MNEPLKTPTPAPPNPEHGNGFRHWQDAPGPFTKLNFWVAQYRVFVYIGFAGLVWFGLQVTGPGARMGKAEERISALERSVSKLVQTSEAIARLQCFNTGYTREQRELAGLDCDAVLRGEYVKSRP